MTDLIRTSKFIALALRHKPDAVGLKLDGEGWAKIPELLSGLKAMGAPLTRAELDKLVADDDKGRYVISADGERIRAAQGHSIKIDAGLKPATPPELLYHGTVEKFLDSIRATGVDKRQRHHIHLSADIDTATKVGQRRGKPVILTIRASEMARAGHAFFISENGVWLVDHVPIAFIDGLSPS